MARHRSKGGESKSYQARADALAEQWHREIKHDADRGWWMCYDPRSGCWAREKSRVEYDIHKAAEKFDPTDIHLARKLRSVLVVHPDISVSSDVWDTEMHVVGTPNGVYDLDDAAEVELAMLRMVTRRLGARIGNAKDCPRWKSFLSEVARGDQAVVDYLQRWCGYCLSGYTTEHACMFVHGPGGNGKSVFVETLKAAFGEYAKTLPMDALMDNEGGRHPSDIAMLTGVRLAVASETQEGRRWDEAKLKSLTGGDRISARFMRQDWFEFTPRFKLLIVGNHAPQFSSVDDALRRRLHIVPFIHKPENPDPDLASTLLTELRGILGWCLDGFAEWREQGLNAPESVLAATNEYFDDQDTMGVFLAECTEAAPGGYVSSASVVEAYRKWAEANGFGPKSSKRLGAELRKRGWRPVHNRNERGFEGMRLRAAGDGEYLLPT